MPEGLRYAGRALNTTNPYIKYSAITYFGVPSIQNNTTPINFTVKAVNSSTSTLYTGCTQTTYVRFDGVDLDPQSHILGNGIENGGWISPGPDGNIYDGTATFNLSDYNITHELDGTKILHVEIKLVIKDSEDTVVLDSVYQSFDIPFERIERKPAIRVPFSIQYITEHSFILYSEALGPDLGNDPPPPPIPEPPGNPHYTIWYYSTDGGVSWIDCGTSTIFTPIVPDTGLGDIFRHSTKLVNISGLEPDTDYDVILAVSTNVLDNPPEGESWTPDDAPYGVFAYSTRITLTTDGIPPIPDVPSTRGVARRITLFDETETEFITNGLGSLIEAFSCKVTEEINGMFELEMEYPVDGRHFNDIDFGRIITANPNQYSRPQPFRIYKISKPHDGKVTINAQHISYDLSGITIAPFRAGSAMGVLAEFQYGPGCLCDVPCPFQFWTDVYGYSEFRTYTPTTIRSLMGGSDSSLQGIYGGEWEFDVYNARLWQQRGVDRGVVIRYGKNLTSLKQEANCSNVYTAVRPYWYKEPSDDDPNAGGLVELPEKIIDITGTFDYDKVLLLDLSSEFDEKPTVAELRTAANTYIAENNVGVPIVSLSVSFVQLSDSLEYQDIAVLEQVKLGDYVSVDFPKLNIRANGIECIKTVFNVMSQRYDSIDLGTPKSSLANTVASNSQSASNSVSKSEMQHAINTSTNSSSSDQTYVVMDRSVSPARLLVMDKAKQANATNIYKWSFDGLSHSSNGVNGPYSIVMPIDGTELNLPGTISCVELDQTTPTIELKNGHILKQIRW